MTHSFKGSVRQQVQQRGELLRRAGGARSRRADRRSARSQDSEGPQASKMIRKRDVAYQPATKRDAAGRL